jgi:ketosteroid isomerase-like protein
MSADEILALERAALDRWGHGDPGGFLDVYAADITYFDPVTDARIDGRHAMENYYRPWIGKIHIARYEILNPQVVVDGQMALLTYNLVNYARDAGGVESVGSRWNSTTVYQRVNGAWKSIHSHWSFTRHAAFQQVSPEASERQGA